MAPQIASKSGAERRILDDIKTATRPNQHVAILEIDDYAFVVR
jgi:hypothetical protein